MNTELREKVAELEHQQWAFWRKEIERAYGEKVGNSTWSYVDYEDLPELIKDEDRIWADKVIALVLQEVFEKIAEIEEKYKFQYDSEGCESCVLALQQLKQSLGGKEQ